MTYYTNKVALPTELTDQLNSLQRFNKKSLVDPLRIELRHTFKKEAN